MEISGSTPTENLVDERKRAHLGRLRITRLGRIPEATTIVTNPTQSISIVATNAMPRFNQRGNEHDAREGAGRSGNAKNPGMKAKS
jgi:hypothetical protein